MATTQDLITELYVGYFGRAPDPDGLNYWVGRYNGVGGPAMTLAEIAQSFSVQPETTSNYAYLDFANKYPNLPNPVNPDDFITEIYQNLFNRNPDAVGLAYWHDQLVNQGKLPGQMIVDIISGAQGTDAVIMANKVSVGEYYAAKIGGTPGASWNASTDPGDMNDAHAVLSGVTADPATVTAGKVTADKLVAVDANGGLTFDLVHETAAGADVMRITGNQTVRIDLTNSNQQIRGLDLNGDGVIANDGHENNAPVAASGYEIVDAYARDTLVDADIAKNFIADINFDGTGYGGDGVNTDGNIYLGGLGVDRAFAGIGNDFMAGGGVAAGRFVQEVLENGNTVVRDTLTGKFVPWGNIPADYLSTGRNADFMFAELSALDPTDGNGTTFDGGNTTDDSAAGLPAYLSGVNSQNNDWLLPEASDDDEPVEINLAAGFIETRSGKGAGLIDIESVDASGNLYGFLNDMNVEIGGRAKDARSVAPVPGTENYGIGSTAQLNIVGGDAANVLIGGYDNDAISGGSGDDILMGGNLGFLETYKVNPNLLDANGGLNLNVSAKGTVTEGRDNLIGDAGNDNIVFEMDGGMVSGGTDTGTTSGDQAKNTGDTLWLTNYSMGRVQGATTAGEATAQKDALAKVTTDSVVRFDLGNDGAASFKNYGGSNAASQDQTNYATGLAAVATTGMESVIATGLGAIDFKAAGNNSPELHFNNQQNFRAINADLALRGDGKDNTLYANTGKDVIEGRGGDDNLSGGTNDDDFVFAYGDGVDVVHRQKDANGDNLWDTGADGKGLFVQDFRAPQVGDISSSRLTVNFGATDLTSTNVAVVSFSIKIGGVTFAVSDPAALAGAKSIGALATVVDTAFHAQDANVSVVAVGNALVVTDKAGRDMSDTLAEGFLVGVALSGSSASADASFVPGGTPINVVENDRLIFKTYDNRGINLGTNETTNEISNAQDLVARFDTTGTQLAEQQKVLVKLVDVSEGDKVTITINGKDYSYTAKAGETAETVAANLVTAINNELDLNSASGRITAVNNAEVAEFDENDTAAGIQDVLANNAVLSVAQTVVDNSQVFMNVSVNITNSLTGSAAGTATLHNQSNTYVDLVGFDGRDGNLNGSDVLFLGRTNNSVSLLQTAKNAGETLTGKDATDDQDTALAWINGDDLLIGGNGNDTINGGTGDDNILVSKGTDTVDGGGNVTENGTTVAFTDVLQAEEYTFGTGSRFKVVLDGTLGDAGKGKGVLTALSSTDAALGTTTFSGIETVRVLENSRESSLDVSALSNSVATAVGTNAMIGTEGLTVNLTRLAPSVTYSVDNSAPNNGSVLDAGDYNNFVATQVYGAEHVTGGNANDTVNIDVSQITASNKISLGTQQDNTDPVVLLKGYDAVNYDHTFLAAADRPTMTVKVESSANVDTVSLTGGVLGSTTTSDTLTDVERLGVANGANSDRFDDVLDVSGINGATVNYGADILLGASLGGQVAPETSIAIKDNNRLDGASVAASSALSKELITFSNGITALERLTGSAGNDRAILADTMGSKGAGTTNIAVASYLGAANTVAARDNLTFQLDLAGGTSDILDYRQETGGVAVVVDYTGGKDSVIVDQNNNGNVTEVNDRVDQASNVERYFASTGVARIDLGSATEATTVQFSAESKVAGNEFFDPNGRSNPVVDNQVRGISVYKTGDSANPLARFMDADAGATASSPAAYWDVVEGSKYAETVNFTNFENSIAETLNLRGGANVVSYGGLTTPGIEIAASIAAGSQTYTVTPNGGAADTITITRNVDNGSLTLIATNDIDDLIVNTFNAPTALAGVAAASLDITGTVGGGYHLIDLGASGIGQVVEDVKLNIAGPYTTADYANKVTSIQNFENATGGNQEDRIYGNAANNVLDGMGGNDILSGGAGADQVRGNLGDDRFTLNSINDGNTGVGGVAATNADAFLDFDAFGNDRLVIDSNLFAQLYQPAGTTVNVDPLAVATNGANLNNGNVFLITNAVAGGNAGLEIAANVAAAIGTIAGGAVGDGKFLGAAGANNVSQAAVFVVGAGAGLNAGVYVYEDRDDNNTVSANELKLVSIINGQGMVAAGVDAAGTFTQADVTMHISGRSGQQTIFTDSVFGTAPTELAYSNVNESRIGFVDAVWGFTPGADKIDLTGLFAGKTLQQSAIAAIRSTTIGGNNTGVDVPDFFNDGGVDRAVVVEQYLAGANTRVFVDADQNGDLNVGTDLVVDFVGVVPITANDFVYM